MNRRLFLDEGKAFIITDIHGAWEPYLIYRDAFLDLYSRGEADTFILLGDTIHGNALPGVDRSLEIILDILRLRDELGESRVQMLLGNHELPHIYSVSLSKGNKDYTARMEWAMGPHRNRIVDFFMDLPFLIETSGGLLMSHAGLDLETPLDEGDAEKLLNWSHQKMINEAEDLLVEADIPVFLKNALGWDEDYYLSFAHDEFAVTGPEDPRYLDVLKGIVISSGFEDFDLLWDFYFPIAIEHYSPQSVIRTMSARYLDLYGAESPRVLLTGHLPAEDGYLVVADNMFRLASYKGAYPPDNGAALLVDVAEPVNSASDLIKGILYLSDLDG